jgi:hypothetical protein
VCGVVPDSESNNYTADNIVYLTVLFFSHCFFAAECFAHFDIYKLGGLKV